LDYNWKTVPVHLEAKGRVFGWETEAVQTPLDLNRKKRKKESRREGKTSVHITVKNSRNHDSVLSQSHRTPRKAQKEDEIVETLKGPINHKSVGRSEEKNKHIRQLDG